MSTFSCSQSQRRVVVYARPATVTSSTGCYDDIVNKILERCKSVYKDLVYIGYAYSRREVKCSWHITGWAVALTCYTPCFRKKTSTHIIGYKLRNSCLILIIFGIKIPHII